MKKGITPVIAIILLLLVTISIVGFAFTFFSRLVQTAGEEGEETLQGSSEQIGISFLVESVHNNEIYIRNTGRTEINSSIIGVYLDNRIMNPTNSVTIPPNNVGVLTFDENIVGNSLKVTAGLQKSEIRAPNVAVYMLDEYEHFSNGNRCSDDLFVIENNRIKFFVSVPRTYSPNTGYDCASGVSSYDDSYAGIPMRIWAKDTQSSSYKLNEAVIDDTHIYAPSSTSVDSIDSFIAFENGLEIEFNQQGNIKPKVVYTTEHDKNYVKVDIIAVNIGSSPESIRLYWSGDQDGAGTCRFQSGVQDSCGGEPLQVNAGEKWLAEWQGFNDMMGYVVLDGEIEIYGIYEQIRVEETLSTEVQPGGMHKFTFYIVADDKIAGNEWKPVEDLYNELSGV